MWAGMGSSKFRAANVAGKRVLGAAPLQGGAGVWQDAIAAAPSSLYSFLSTCVDLNNRKGGSGDPPHSTPPHPAFFSIYYAGTETLGGASTCELSTAECLTLCENSGTKQRTGFGPVSEMHSSHSVTPSVQWAFIQHLCVPSPAPS